MGLIWSVEFQATRKEFEGDITLVVFPMLKVVKGNPVAIGESGAYLVEQIGASGSFQCGEGFFEFGIEWCLLP